MEILQMLWELLWALALGVPLVEKKPQIEMICLGPRPFPCIDPLTPSERNVVMLACGRKLSLNETDKSTIKISGGVLAGENDATWAAATVLGSDKTKLQCSGSVVSPRHVVVAAHCFWSDGKYEQDATTKYKVAYGSYCLCKIPNHCTKEEAARTILYDISSIWIPSTFSAGVVKSGDFAIIQIDTPIRFTGTQMPICFLQSIKEDFVTAANEWKERTCSPGHLLQTAGFSFDANEPMPPRENRGRLRLLYSNFKPNLHNNYLVSLSVPVQDENVLPDTVTGDSGAGVACKWNAGTHQERWILASVLRGKPKDSQGGEMPGFAISSFMSYYGNIVCPVTNFCFNAGNDGELM